jgi:limonene-1,2-epoxide hydrolase
VRGDVDRSQDNLELMLGWLDALRRRDYDTVAGALHPEVVWQGVADGLVCHGSEEVVRIFRAERESDHEIEALELVGSGDKVVLGARRPDLVEIGGVELHGQIFNVFGLRGGRIIDIRDYPTRREALGAAA